MRNIAIIFTATMASICVTWAFASGMDSLPDNAVVHFFYVALMLMSAPTAWLAVANTLGGIRGN